MTRHLIEHVVVVVPARNEAAVIARCLGSIATAREHLPSRITSTVIVIADTCTDETGCVARAMLAGDPHSECIAADEGSAGSARRLGTEHVLRNSPVPHDRVWVATTDADTMVSVDWLTQQVHLAERGAIGVAGIVALDPTTFDDPVLAHQFQSTYLLGDDGTHPHIHGANMGFRADAYVAVGGWNILATGEDHDLWNRLRSIGPLVSTTELVVATHARLLGRAPAGFAAELAKLHHAARRTPARTAGTLIRSSVA